MSTVITRGEPLSRDDLKIFIQDLNGNYVSPAWITYTIYRVISDRFYNQECGEEPILETINSVPLPFGIGKFYAAWQMPHDISVGTFRIKWNFKEFPDSRIQEEVQEFNIVQKATTRAEACASASGSSLLPHNMFKGGCAEGV